MAARGLGRLALAAPRAVAAPFVGRAAEVAAVSGALDAGARLVWVVGPPGVGKSRVADAAAHAFAAAAGARHFAIGIDEHASVETLEDAVAAATGTGTAPRRGRGADAPPSLSEIGPAVLVIDPLDRLEAEPLLARWLDASPELAIVACTRRRPAETGAPVVEIGVLSAEAAAELFLAYGALARPGLALATDEDRAAVARIVADLDALPLALELAAARLAVMSPPALAHRLRNRWDILRRQGSGRHRALEEAIRWSLDLLPRRAREVLAAATVFRGGFALEAAEAVLGDTEAPGEAPLLDTLELLRNESLLIAAEAPRLPGEVRLTMHESVRLLAERDLDERARAGLEERHAIALATAAETWAREVELRGSPAARAQLELERENLVAVVERILGRPGVSARAADRALRVLCAVGPVLLREGAAARLETHLESALAVAQGSGADPRLMARALALRGPLRHARGLPSECERDLAEALVLASHAGERALEGRIGVVSAELAVRDGHATPARLGIERADAIAHERSDRALRALARAAAGALALLEDAPLAARAALEEALGLAKDLGDDALAARAERRLGRLELGLGDLAAAEARFETARTLAVSLGDPRGEALALCGLGVARGAVGDLDGATQVLEAALAVARRAARPALLSTALVLSGVAHAAAGARGEARARLGERVGAADLDARTRLAGLVALARLEAAGGRREAAEALVSRARDVLEATAPERPGLARWGAALLADPLGRGAAPAGDGLAALALRVPTSGAPPSVRPAVAHALVVEDGGRGFAVDGGARVDLSKRRPLRLLLDALAGAHTAGGTALGWEALLAHGWPGEKMRPDAGAHRVRVAVSTLRKMGLGAVLETDEGGYRIARGVMLTRR